MTVPFVPSPNVAVDVNASLAVPYTTSYPAIVASYEEMLDQFTVAAVLVTYDTLSAVGCM